MIYLGKTVHLCYDDPDFRDEIKVYQQHCGGENLCVYRGKLLEKGTHAMGILFNVIDKLLISEWLQFLYEIMHTHGLLKQLPQSESGYTAP